MNNKDLICLSSDEDEPQIKKIKISPVRELKENSKVNGEKVESTNSSIICLDSDEDADSQDSIVNKENIEANGISLPTEGEENNTETEFNVTETSCDNSKTKNEKSKGTDVMCTNKTDSTVPENNEDVDKTEKTQEKDEVNSSGNDIDLLLSTTENLPSEALTFLTTCQLKLQGSASADRIFKKFPSLIKMFKELSDEFSKSIYLQTFMKKQTKIAKESVNCCIVSFKDVYEHLKMSLESEGVELSKKHWKHVRKLEHVMQQIVSKLEEFNETEVDFEADEDDSPYMKHERYSQRLCRIYKKYCHFLKKNPYAGRITYERLAFVSSHYNEINLAICKKYKNNSVFPSYDELATYIQSVVEENGLPLSGAELKVESEHCFKKLGDLLQLRRKKELYEAHCSYIINNQDPADNDKELDTKLRTNLKEGKIKIEEVCAEFVKKQELGINKEEIDCSDTNDDNEDDEEEENIEEELNAVDDE